MAVAICSEDSCHCVPIFVDHHQQAKSHSNAVAQPNLTTSTRTMAKKQELVPLKDRNHEQHPDNFKEELHENDSIGLLGLSDHESDHHDEDLSGYHSMGKTGDTSTSDDGINSPHELSGIESFRVFRLRMAVISVLILTALAVSAAVFKITVQGEVDEFETQYEGAAIKVIDSFAEIMDKMGSVAGLGVSYTSQGRHQVVEEGHIINSSWPFVTLEDFPPKARNVLQLSGALMVGMGPVLGGTMFRSWDEYVRNPLQTIWM